MKRCPQCGDTYADIEGFCAREGSPLINDDPPDVPESPHRDRQPVVIPAKVTRWILFVLGIWIIWPGVVSAIASLIAKVCGCKVDEANDYPCIVSGVDIGEQLGIWFTVGWFLLFTLPSGIVLGIIVFAIVFFVYKRRPADLGRQAQIR